MSQAVFQRCIRPECGATFDVGEVLFGCPRCGELLDVAYEWDRLAVPAKLSDIEKRWATRNNPLDFSGVWRFRDLAPFVKEKYCVTLGEGQTLLENSPGIARYVGSRSGRVFLQYEGLNPSGSFKDNGMAGAFTHARLVGAKRVACASTGNTSASMALFARYAGMEAIVLIGEGKIAYGKLAQALDYGALTLQIAGDFDAAMARVKEVVPKLGLYLMNSVNPFRLEGQKAIMFRVLEALRWEVPDWIIVPGGNLGNSSAFGKAFMELKALGLIPRIPRLAVINAAGADTLYRIVEQEGLRWDGGHCDDAKIDRFHREMDDQGRRARTLASAIEINRPVNLKKCLRALEVCSGVVRRVPDQAILDAKARVGRFGLGCEPASAASVAGLKLLRQEGVIGPDERVVCILTGHALKDPTVTVDYHTVENLGAKEKYREVGVEQAAFANRPVRVPDDPAAIAAAIEAA